MIEEWQEYVDAGLKIFGLYGVDGKGDCECGWPECQAIMKHPRISNWPSVPFWSDEQLETFVALGHFSTGFGVVCAGLLVVDVDSRNGGVVSYGKLLEDIPEMVACGFIVETGSGGGSKHLYFQAPEGVAMVQNHPRFKGVDFKSSGYLVGSGSMHASGGRYKTVVGSPSDIGPAPAALIELLRKPEKHRVDYDGSVVDVSEQDIADLLDFVSPSMGYEEWVKVGMAIHHCTGGLGFDLWDAWSSKGAKYPGPGRLERHWHSFGKAANPAGYGTLLHYAREGGYCEPVTFEYEDDAAPPQHGDPLDTTGVDLCRPPGFVGEICAWINSQCLYPRENLAVAASLYAVSCLAGMRHYDELDDMTGNMIAFCVSGSGTGKEAINQAYLKIMRAAGIQGAVHGGFKSEQELMRNLIRHQAAFYSVDEMGIVLRKLDNAGKRGGAAYLEGLVGMIMSVYSKANGFLPITGDLKEEVRDKLRIDLARAEKRLGDLPADSGSDMTRGRLESQCARLQSALVTIDDGLDSPYLGIIGYTTPVTFNDLMTFEQATNGFMARAMIFSDLDTNPKRKSGFSRAPMPESLAGAIRNLYAPGVYDMADPDQRVEYVDDKTPVPTTPDGAELLAQVYERFHALAEEHKGGTGLEAIPRRGYEIAAKVSLILALPGGVRTAEHILWGYAIARRDVELKVRMAYSTEHAEQSSGLAARVLSLVTGEHGETLGVICNRLRSTPKAQVEKLLADMVDKGMLRVVESVHPKKKTTISRYFSIG